MDQSIVRYTCVPLRFLVAYAFGMPVIEPDWMKESSSLKFDIVARIPKDATNAQVPEMFQALLRDRFKLSTRRGTHDETVQALLADSGGLKLKPASPQTLAPLPDLSVPCLPLVEGCVHRIINSGGEQIIEIAVSPGVRSYTSSNIRAALRKDPPGGVGSIRMEAPNTTLAGLASLASMLPTDQPKIVDMTGLTGRYDVVLEIPVDVRGSNNRLGPLSRAAEAAGRTGTPRRGCLEGCDGGRNGEDSCYGTAGVRDGITKTWTSAGAAQVAHSGPYHRPSGKITDRQLVCHPKVSWLSPGHAGQEHANPPKQSTDFGPRTMATRLCRGTVQSSMPGFSSATKKNSSQRMPHSPQPFTTIFHLYLPIIRAFRKHTPKSALPPC